MLNSKPFPFGGCFNNDDPTTELYFIGIGDDSQSSYLRGAAEAPNMIRQSFDGNCYSSVTESGIDLNGCVYDSGNLLPEETGFAFYTNAIERILKGGKKLFVAGGDHAVTIPVVEAFRVLGKPIHYIQFDAHSDLYPSFEGSRISHACTGARLAEMSHVSKMVLVGIRYMHPCQQEVADLHKSKIQIVSARDISTDLPDWLGRDPGIPVYVSIDMDGFDPAYAPGVSHPVPGGLTPRQVLNLIHQAEWDLVGMDVVETNPLRDINNQTSILAGKLLHEGMGYVRRKNRVL